MVPSAPPEEGSDFHAAPNRTAGPVVHAAPFARPVVDAAMSHGRLLSGINWASGAGSLRASSPVHECHPPVVHQTQPDAMWLLLLHETWSPASSECRRKSDHQPRRRGQRVRGHGAAQAGHRGAQCHPHAQPPGAFQVWAQIPESTPDPKPACHSQARTLPRPRPSGVPQSPCWIIAVLRPLRITITSSV